MSVWDFAKSSPFLFTFLAFFAIAGLVDMVRVIAIGLRSEADSSDADLESDDDG